MSDENRADVEIVELCDDDRAQDARGARDMEAPAAPPRGAALSVLWWLEGEPDRSA